MKKRKSLTIKIKALRKHANYEKLQRKAYFDLLVLEEYYGKWNIEQKKVFLEMKKHLEAQQKADSYFGFRGFTIGLIVALIVYLFIVQIPTKFLFLKELSGSWFLKTAGAVIGLVLIILYSFIDRERRKQIYIREYMVKLIDEKIECNKRENS
ncbi:hypothetical protein [Heyndrickxia acidicola]|uniref:Uncharacterized protein n=1 Tax=Heyndrickxia acidicola TaxID=209389 RepID=A0ABU6MEB0_9BACI|nr:hypothetical protein [Heyndrickxia acidicola]MED1202371.1 hypothetical protein [Heyndrickxia acidicola]